MKASCHLLHLTPLIFLFPLDYPITSLLSSFYSPQNSDISSDYFWSNNSFPPPITDSFSKQSNTSLIIFVSNVFLFAISEITSRFIVLFIILWLLVIICSTLARTISVILLVRIILTNYKLLIFFLVIFIENLCGFASMILSFRIAIDHLPLTSIGFLL